MSTITTIISAIGTNPHIIESVNSALLLSQEVLVINMGMDTRELQQLQTLNMVRVITHEPVSHIELLREQSKELADSEYVLFLDPDEVLPQTLSTMLKEQYEAYDIIKIPRKNMIMGKWIEHARWWPDYQIRLFKKDAATWPTEIHKQPETKGKELILEPKEDLAILHYNYDTLDQYLVKMIRYAKAEATTKYEKKEQYNLATSLKDGTNEFISRYFAGDGYKDGMHGFALSFLQLMYYPLVYFYLWEMKKYEEEAEKTTESFFLFTKKLLAESSHWILEKKLIKGFNSFRHSIITRILK